MKTTTYTCDCGCGAVRGEANHWYLVIVGKVDFYVRPWLESSAASCEHAAGPACVTRMLQQWIETQRNNNL